MKYAKMNVNTRLYPIIKKSVKVVKLNYIDKILQRGFFQIFEEPSVISGHQYHVIPMFWVF